MYLLSRVWCNGSTAAFQASGEGSSPFARKDRLQTFPNIQLLSKNQSEGIEQWCDLEQE